MVKITGQLPGNDGKIYDVLVEPHGSVIPPDPITHVATTTSLSVSPSSPGAAGASVTLTASHSPSAVAGVTEFFDGDAIVDATHVPTVGTHAYTAEFTPTIYDPSASAASSFVVNPPASATPTTTSLSISPASPQVTGTAVTLSASVSPAGAPGTFKFYDGTTEVSATHTPATGTHAYTASFTPTNPANYAASVSSVATYSITAAGETPFTKAAWNPTTTWAWQYDTKLGNTVSLDQYAEADVSGLSTSEYNAGFILRCNTAGTSGLLVAVSGTQWKIEGAGLTDKSGAFTHASSGKLRAELTGSTVKIYFAGVLVTTQSVSGYTATTKGVAPAAWQETAAVHMTNIKASSL